MSLRCLQCPGKEMDLNFWLLTINVIEMVVFFLQLHVSSHLPSVKFSIHTMTVLLKVQST